MSASSASETGSTVDNENGDDDDDGDLPPSKQRGQGLPLPEVVHRLLKEPQIIRWDPAQRYVQLLRRCSGWYYSSKSSKSTESSAAGVSKCSMVQNLSAGSTSFAK
jgi:hypothetical protein